MIGIDISKDTLDVCVLSSAVCVLEKVVENTGKALKGLFNELRTVGVGPENSWFCAEHTGVYGLLLRQMLEQEGFSYSMLPALEVMRSIGMTRGKNDRVDARRIAEYAQRFQDRLSSDRLPPEHLRQLKTLFSFRKQRVKRCTMLKNQIKQMDKALGSQDRFMLRVARKELKDAQKIINEVEQRMIRLIEELEEVKENYELLRSVNGIGHLTACYLLIVTDNFSRFDDARKFASFSGIAPFDHSSGTSIRGKTRTSRLRDRQIKTLLMSGVNSAIRGKNELSSYFKRKTEQGKHKNVVKNAIAFKLITRAFAVIKRRTPYVTTYQHVFA